MAAAPIAPARQAHSSSSRARKIRRTSLSYSRKDLSQFSDEAAAFSAASLSSLESFKDASSLLLSSPSSLLKLPASSRQALASLLESSSSVNCELELALKASSSADCILESSASLAEISSNLASSGAEIP